MIPSQLPVRTMSTGDSASDLPRSSSERRHLEKNWSLFVVKVQKNIFQLDIKYTGDEFLEEEEEKVLAPTKKKSKKIVRKSSLPNKKATIVKLEEKENNGFQDDEDKDGFPGYPDRPDPFFDSDDDNDDPAKTEEDFFGDESEMVEKKEEKVEEPELVNGIPVTNPLVVNAK